MLNKVATYSAFALIGSAVASPLDAGIFERDACNHDNLLRCFLDTRYSTSASAYCSGLTPFTTTVETVTATVTSTAYATVTTSTEVDTDYETTTVFTATVPSATITQGGGQTFKKKRVPTTYQLPGPLPSCAATFPASRLTSACSCFGVPASTASVTYTAGTVTQTSTLTAYAVATTTATAVETVDAVLTSGVITATAPAVPDLPLIINGDFDHPTVPDTILPWVINSQDEWYSYTFDALNYIGPGFDISFMIIVSIPFSGTITSNQFTLKAGFHYTLSYVAAHCDVAGGDLGSILLAQVVDVTGAQLFSTQSTGGRQIDPFGRRYSYNFRAPTGADSKAALQFLLTTNDVNCGLVLDGVSIVINDQP